MRKNKSVVLIIILFVFGVFLMYISQHNMVLISGISMYPTLESGNYVKIGETKEVYERDEIVIAKSAVLNVNVIKRIIGLPGETITITPDGVSIDGIMLDEPYINQEETATYTNAQYTLGEYEYFLMGDNRNHSSDSRELGAFSQDTILGVAGITVSETMLKIVRIIGLIVCVASILLATYSPNVKNKEEKGEENGNSKL